MKKELTVLATLALAAALTPVTFAQQDQSNSTSSSSSATQQQPSSASPSSASPSSDAQSSASPNSGAQSSATPSTSQDSSAASASSAQSQPFTGTVVKAGSKYVLKTTDATYQLDDQEKARKFEGQQVKVNGALDQSTSTIHIADINPGS
ncbi:MAG: hypothetical protein DMG68_19955 [Acidobacteria bacterium]|jgi:hypothetical protein|nr:MAG: hypothetical protein DMG68_19955 [Acidobacteriota bacterium]